MTRLGYLLFNILVMIAVYVPLYWSKARHGALMYTVIYFAVPFIGMNLLMAVYSLVHWFIKQDPEISAQGATFLNATWITGVITALVYYVLSTPGLFRFLH